jgi:serine protease
VVVCAAGNNGRTVESPANSPGAVAVSAIDSGDQLAFFSSRGPELAIAAPGVNILQQTICDHGRNRCEQFAAWSGTSMAAPHVAGVAALVFSLGVTDPAAVEAILKRSASPPAHGGQNPELYGAGIVSAEGATREVLGAHGRGRGLALLALTALVLWLVKRRNGEVSWTFLPTALLTGVGAFFLPWVVSRTVPGVDLAMRPVAEWDLYFLGVPWHRWLLFANGFTVLALVGLGFGRPWARAPIGGVALGVSAYLLASLFQGDAFRPLGTVLFGAWVLLNLLLCLWVATIGVDRKAR